MTTGKYSTMNTWKVFFFFFFLKQYLLYYIHKHCDKVGGEGHHFHSQDWSRWHRVPYALSRKGKLNYIKCAYVYTVLVLILCLLQKAELMRVRLLWVHETWQKKFALAGLCGGGFNPSIWAVGVSGCWKGQTDLSCGNCIACGGGQGVVRGFLLIVRLIPQKFGIIVSNPLCW